jgi:hypothetical protein
MKIIAAIDGHPICRISPKFVDDQSHGSESTKKKKKKWPGRRSPIARTEVSSMSLIAFQKSEGDAKWMRCPESVAIPTGILLADYVMPGSVVLPAPVPAAHDGSGTAAGATGGGDCDMGLHD